MVIGPDGNLYVMSADDDSVMRFDGTTGTPLPAPRKSGAVFVDPGTLLYAYGELAFGPDGDLYVSNFGGNDVLRIDSQTGKSLGEFVPAGDHGLNGAHGLVFGPDGNLYVVSQGTNSVLRYNGLTGTFIDVFCPPEHLYGPTYLTFWDTEGSGSMGPSGKRSVHGAASALHAVALADASVPVGSPGIPGRVQDGNPLGGAALSLDPRPANAVMAAQTVLPTASRTAAGLAARLVSPARTRVVKDPLFGAVATRDPLSTTVPTG
jgi:hypothetical protein